MINIMVIQKMHKDSKKCTRRILCLEYTLIIIKRKNTLYLKYTFTLD